MKAKPAIDNGTKVYMIFHDCLCYVTVDYSSDDNPTTYHVENSEVFFTEDDIGKTVFFNEEDAKRVMNNLLEGEHATDTREFDGKTAIEIYRTDMLKLLHKAIDNIGSTGYTAEAAAYANGYQAGLERAIDILEDNWREYDG